jgi:hypothetical protein
VCDGCAQGSGTIRGEAAGGLASQRSVDEIGEHGLDDGVAAVGDVSLGGRLDGSLETVATACVTKAVDSVPGHGGWPVRPLQSSSR